MSARVDVLAVMDRNAVQATDTRIALEWSPQWLKESAEQDAVARAAVAELIEAAEHASNVLAETYAKYQTKIGPFASQSQVANGKLRAALAKATP